MTTVECIQKRLVEICYERHLSFNKLAYISGVHPSTVKGIMNGASKNPGVVTLKKLCDGLDMTLTEFFDTGYFRVLEQEIK